jgi:dienelactone hydrolase
MINHEDASAYQIKVTPEGAMVDEKVSIRLTGFDPNQLVTVRAKTRDDLGRLWESSAVFKTDSQGVIDLSTHKPLSGSYDDVDSMGLFWSLALNINERDFSPFFQRTRTPLKPLQMTFLAEIDGKTMTSVSHKRCFLAPNINRTPIREDGLVGTLFHSTDSDPQPGVIVLSGSGGGLLEKYAALIASHGFTVLALAYFRMEDLPSTLTLIPLEYFKKGINWMQAHEKVIDDKIAALGRSRGGELVLLLAATFPDIKAVVAYVPSGVVHANVAGTLLDRKESSWTHHGEPLPYVPFKVTDSDMMEFMRKENASWPIRLTPYFLRAMNNTDAVENSTIPVEKINGPILLISGQDDQLWPSDFFTGLIVKRLIEHKFSHSFKHLSYQGAGHRITFPYIPKTFTISRHPVTGMCYDAGGNAKDDAFGSSDSWFYILQFLEKSLKGDERS